MGNLWMCLLLLALLQTWSPVTSFPLQGCTREDIELLLISGGLEEGDSAKERQKNQTDFFKQIIDLFLASHEVNLTRVRVAVASVDLNGPELHFGFSAYNTSDELYSALSDLLIKLSNDQFEPKMLPEKIANFTQNMFSPQNGCREVAIHAAILVVDGGIFWTADEVANVIKIQGKNNVDFLVVVIGSFREEEDNVAVKNLENAVAITSYSKLENNQLVAMNLCKVCAPGWFRYEHKNKENRVSCFLLYEARLPTKSWIDAFIKCDVLGGSLASLESVQEIAEVKSFVDRQYASGNISSNRDDANDTHAHQDLVYIGLKRDEATIAKRFQWLSKYPLVWPRWMKGHPNKGIDTKCGAWLFTQNGTDGWIDIGCGFTATRHYLCEVTLSSSILPNSALINIEPPSNKSIENALQKGEMIRDSDGNIMSIAANVDKSDIKEQLAKKGQPLNLFECDENSFKNSEISYSKVCDHADDCRNGRDEEICVYRHCADSLEYTCGNAQCVPIQAKCDIYVDCPNGEDEESCIECKGKRCSDGACYPKHWFFDGEVDCSVCKPKDLMFENLVDDEIWQDGDETETYSNSCLFICNRTECVYSPMLNDGVSDCTGPEGPLDETLGKLEVYHWCFVETLGYKRWSPKCVYVKDKYGGLLGCRDMSHLHGCHNFKCPEGYVKCPESYCIPLHYIKNGIMDCPDGEDERGEYSCNQNFACSKSKVCLHPDLVCDGHPHCPKGDDELNCRVSCPSGFYCINGVVTVANYDISKPLKSLKEFDPRTKYLNLSGVDLSKNFTNDERGNFPSLLEISFSKCRIPDASGNFAADTRTLRTVISVDLSYNLIREIPAIGSMFQYMTNLRWLNLSYNRNLTTLYAGGLKPRSDDSRLAYLDLSYTGISVINAAAFQNLISLVDLNLSFSQINELGDNSKFPDNFPLRTLNIRGIPLSKIYADALEGLSIEKDFQTDTYKLCCPQLRGENIPEHVCHAPKDAISSCSDLVKDAGPRMLVWMVGIIAVLGNAVVILYRLLWEREAMKRTIGFFTTNLGVSDFTMGIYLLIIAGADMEYRGSYVWNENTWRHGSLCRAAGFLSTFSSETSTFFIFLITLDRFMVIKYPFGECRFSKAGMITATIVAWVAGFILALLPVLPMHSHWKIFSSNGMCLGLPLTTERLEGWEYSVTVFIVLNFVMFVVIAAGQFFIYKAMSDNRISKSFFDDGAVQSRRAQDIAVAKQLSLVVVSDFLCWFPIGLMGLLALSGIDIGTDAYAWSAVLVLPVNSALNPVLYTVPVLINQWEKFMAGHRKKHHGNGTCDTSMCDMKTKIVNGMQYAGSADTLEWTSKT